MPNTMRPGNVLAGRYRLVDLLNEARGGLFFRAWDKVLARHVAVHIIPRDDERADTLMAAARTSAVLLDPRLLRVLDAGTSGDLCYVVNEWGEGVSLDHLLDEEPLNPRRGAWIVGEVAELIAAAHSQGILHARLVPEAVLLDETGAVKVIGFAVDSALHGNPTTSPEAEVTDLAALLYAVLTGKWAGREGSRLPPAPDEHGKTLRPRQVRAGVPRILDTLCDEVLSPFPGPHDHGYGSASAIAFALMDYVGDPAAMAAAEAARSRENTSPRIPRIEADPTLFPTESPPEQQHEADPGPDTGPESDTGEETVIGAPVFDHDDPISD
ncbi:MAG: protein kinase family protein, partial [Nocardioides sp.]|nr:protein kinase family protein [Nocardioides sp.]